MALLVREKDRFLLLWDCPVLLVLFGTKDEWVLPVNWKWAAWKRRPGGIVFRPVQKDLLRWEESLSKSKSPGVTRSLGDRKECDQPESEMDPGIKQTRELQLADPQWWGRTHWKTAATTTKHRRESKLETLLMQRFGSGQALFPLPLLLPKLRLWGFQKA